MKEIGINFKEARESMGITLEEVSEDIKNSLDDLKNLEDGDFKYFNDVNRVKELIETYGKYLGLEYEKMIDDFNEYLFDYTSKISVAAIKKANKKKEKEERLRSPYTKENTQKILIIKGIIAVIFVLLIIFLFYYI